MSELCPKCRELQNVKVTVSSRKVEALDARTKAIKTSTFHCEVCGSFIRSEDEELTRNDEVGLSCGT